MLTEGKHCFFLFRFSKEALIGFYLVCGVKMFFYKHGTEGGEWKLVLFFLDFSFLCIS